jgi:ABC-type amino acid transport substrate-binding protein
MRLKLLLTATALCIASHAAIAQELMGTLEKIKSSGMIAIGHRESSIPFSYYDKNEKVVGYGMDLCTQRAHRHVMIARGRVKFRRMLFCVAQEHGDLRLRRIFDGNLQLCFGGHLLCHVKR